MTTYDSLIDTLLDGRYRVVRKLGTGGMANVYLAEDQELGRRVAIKLLDERHAQDEQFVERFRREAESAAGLSHPNIVSIYDRGEAEGTYYIAMEYLEGTTLKELLIRRGPTPVRVAIDYARQILQALDFSHRHGCTDPGSRGGGQDRYGRDRPRQHQHGLVRRVRAGRQPAVRDRRRRREPEPQDGR